MKFRLIAIALVLLVLGIAVGALWVQPASVQIADAGKPEQLKLLPKHPADRITSLHVEGRGRIDGEAEITLLLNGQPYKTERMNGAVDFTWRMDWYATEAVVNYTPLTATGGSLKLRYHFYGL
jgi:hypothetical protein